MLQASHICSPIFHCWLLSAKHIPTPVPSSNTSLSLISFCSFLMPCLSSPGRLAWLCRSLCSSLLLHLSIYHTLNKLGSPIRLPAFAYFWLLASPLSAYSCWASTSVSTSPLGAPEKTPMFSSALHGYCSGCRQSKHLSKSLLALGSIDTPCSMESQILDLEKIHELLLVRGL